MNAIGNTMSAFISQNIGAGKKERIAPGVRSGFVLAAASAAAIFVALESFYRPLIMLFLGEKGSAAAIATGCSYLRFMGWWFILFGAKVLIDGTLRGMQDVRAFTAANLVNLGVRVSAALALAPSIGISVIWQAVPVGWMLNFLISGGRYLHLKKSGFAICPGSQA